jgi:hypothetical protein
MAIMKWGTPPGGNQHDRQAHVVGHGDGVALAHAAFGSKVEGGGAQDLRPGVELATKFSTAPYTGPPVDEEAAATMPNPWGYRSPKRAKRCMANNDTCKGWATKASGYEFCAPHAKLAAQAEAE